MSSAPWHPIRRSPRLAGYDYATPGYYFVTLCVMDRLQLFGSVVDGVMHLTPAGTMVEAAWSDVTQRYAGIAIDTRMVMPDHVHAIVALEDDPARSLSLPDVVHRYKSVTTKRYAHGVREDGWLPFAGKLWQVSFHDHVIREDEDLDAIRRYIGENPMRWEMRRMAGG